MDDDTEFFVPPEKDLTGTVFSNPAFFRFFPVLNHSNVMRYFEESPFYESSTLNAMMKTQLISDPQAVADFLLRSRGYYYEVANSPIVDPQNPQQPIWMITKKYSLGAEGDGDMKKIAVYYIVGQQIFQAPLWKDLAAAKLWQSAAAIHQLLVDYQELAEAVTDVKRETELADRVDDPALLTTARTSLATLEKQFESVLRPQPRTN